MFNFTKIFTSVIVVLLMHIYFYHSDYVKSLDYKVYDFMMTLTHKVGHDKEFYTVIVNIDEKSLEVLGQWPWSRVLSANLVDKINALNPSALGINILFPEVDRSSPVNIKKFYKEFFNLELKFKSVPQYLRDNDKLFLQSVQNARGTLSTYFYDNGYTNKHCQELSYKQNIFATRKPKMGANTFLCNHKELQSGVKNFGFINAWKESDGIFRRVPLFMKYNQKVFPSFALATLMSFDESIAESLPKNEILLNFPLSKPKVFSAIDILKGKVPKEEIEGKIVILGSSLIGLTPIYKTASGTEISNSMIHALAIENILNNNYIRENVFYKKLNLLLSFVLSLWIAYLFFKKFYVKSMLLIFFSITLSFAGTLYFFLDNLYISIAYFWLPFLLMSILFFLEHLRTRSKEHQEQEKFLVRQSKLASMGEMISLIAHQWRQPLSAINGTVLNLDIDYRKKNLDAKRFNNYLDDIEGTTAYLSKTINDFTDFFSKNKEAQVFNVLSVLIQAKHLSSFSLSDKLELHFSEEIDIKVKGYPSELLQSLLVLLNNAIYICQEKLEIIGKGEIYIDVQEQGQNVIFSVEDNGGGVPKKDMKKIFSPYFTSKEKHHGTGLGLYILKLIVEDSMNGKVTLRNGEKGAIFSIEIPKNID